MTAGQEFVKKIRPVGVIIFLLLFVLYFVICLTARPDPLAGYVSPHDAIYYAQNEQTLTALKTELETAVFPLLTGEERCTVEGGKLELVLDGANYKASRSALLKHFDGNLFTFVKSSN